MGTYLDKKTIIPFIKALLTIDNCFSNNELDVVTNGIVGITYFDMDDNIENYWHEIYEWLGKKIEKKKYLKVPQLKSEKDGGIDYD